MLSLIIFIILISSCLILIITLLFFLDLLCWNLGASSTPVHLLCRQIRYMNIWFDIELMSNRFRYEEKKTISSLIYNNCSVFVRAYLNHYNFSKMIINECRVQPIYFCIHFLFNVISTFLGYLMPKRSLENCSDTIYMIAEGIRMFIPLSRVLVWKWKLWRDWSSNSLNLRPQSSTLTIEPWDFIDHWSLDFTYKYIFLKHLPYFLLKENLLFFSSNF